MLREKENVDVVAITMHMGVEEDLRAGKTNPAQVPNENAAIAIARQVPGVDVILMGHTHREVSSLSVRSELSAPIFQSGTSLTFTPYEDVLLTQANRWASHVARVDLDLEKDAKG